METSVWKRKVNLFLLGIPVVLLRERLEFGEWGIYLTFALAALSLIPLAGFLESAVEELAELLGPFLGGLLHTTAANIAELALALSILLTLSNGSEIVLTSVAGVIIRNSLLFLGIATLAGCIRNGKMRFSAQNAGEYSTIFALAVTGLSLPTLAATLFAAQAGAEGGAESSTAAAGTEQVLLIFGRVPFAVAVAIVLLVSYVAYIVFAVFRFRSGENLVELSRRKREERKRRRAGHQPAASASPDESGLVAPDVQALFSEERASAERHLAMQPRHARARLAAERRKAREERGQRGFLAGHRGLRGLLAFGILAVAAAGVVFMSEGFAGSVEDILTSNAGLRQFEFFLGLILIPVLAGAVELYSGIGMARRKRMEITMGITAGASIQMILLVVPVLVIVGALTGHPLNLVFKPLEIIIFGAATFAFMLLSRDGESTMLEGVQLVALWLLLVVTAVFLPPAQEAACAPGATCEGTGGEPAQSQGEGWFAPERLAPPVRVVQRDTASVAIHRVLP